MQIAERPRTPHIDEPGAITAREALKERLVRLNRAAGLVANLLYGPRSVSELRAGESVLTWRWRYQTRSAPSPEVARLSAPEGDVWLSIDRDYNFSPAPSVEWRQLSAEARLLTWTLCYEPIIMHLRKLFGLALVPAALTPLAECPPLPQCVLTFVIETPQGETVLAGAVAFNANLLTPASSSEPQAPQPSRAALALDPVPIVFRVVITTFDLSAAELRTLSLGDIVSLGASSRVRAGGQLRCESIESRLRILVRVEGGAFKVEAIESGRPQVIHSLPEAIRSVSMPPNPDDQAAREADVDALPVTLSFEAGELVLTVGELKGLAPGAMLSLGRRLTDSPITVRANGKVLATGELVLIDDFLGVRITGLRSHGAE